MKKIPTFLIFIALYLSASAQSLYFPPVQGNTWDTLSPQSLNWCPEKMDSLIHFLDTTGTKAFIVLKDGKMVMEQYFDAFTVDSFWYWASAGKTLASFLTGLAQEQGHLSINDPVSDYLGKGWTAMADSLEQQITIRHQLTMTTGLDYTVGNFDCTDPVCLQYKAPPGTQWFYHNAPYTLTHDVVEAATGTNYNVYTYQQLANRTGITGLWFKSGYNEVFGSTPRVMARFGLLMLAGGVWDGDTIMHDQQYLKEMITPSQNLNASYGYLWWLNGQASYMLPTVTFTFPGMLVPNAPPDMYAGLGKNDQKLYVIPSQNMVIVRMGNAANQSKLASSSYDNQLWEYLSHMECNAVGISPAIHPDSESFRITPNPASDYIAITGKASAKGVIIYNRQGQLVDQYLMPKATYRFTISGWPKGVYFVQWLAPGEVITDAFVVQ